ncbi:hypothetical protein Plo01_44170 [Planobispora longispora]|uniref:Uncharacterized protein n=1 Tax=Planobispora longispora TaxID=28887 RepID=A0A8J3W6W4_9ACTN|nr:hypothetical protein Plo01_44170 [Planobispora longispora]
MGGNQDAQLLSSRSSPSPTVMPDVRKLPDIPKLEPADVVWPAAMLTPPPDLRTALSCTR